jgi:subtilase family serine protease
MRLMVLASLAALTTTAVPAVYAQATDQVTQEVDNTRLRALPNHLPGWANPSNLSGAVPADQRLDHLTVVMARSPQTELAFENFIASQKDPSSVNYHHWLTSSEIGERFGPSQHDVGAVTGWLQSQGLRINWVAPSRMFISFGGTAADLGRAFQTELRYYKVHGAQRMSVSSSPMIPEALSPAIKAIHGLYTVEEYPQHRLTGAHAARPEMTVSGGDHFISPADFATIYDVPSAFTGAGVTIGVVGRSRANPADFDNYKILTGVSFPDPTEIVPTAFGGLDPGPALTAPPAAGVDISEQAEVTLDVMRAGSTAPGAQLLLVVASDASGGIEADGQYLVQTTPVPAQVMALSFGVCESQAGEAYVDLWDALFKQGAAEGISSFVASGDAGASGCDQYYAVPPANPAPNSPNYLCSSSYTTCVGGTEFNDASDPATYWNSTNGANLSSVLGYIPEGGWNEPLNGTATIASASGGGVSLFIPTPAWQTGAGVPAARAGRYTPDVAFSAAGHDAYFGCFAAGSASCVVSAGTYSFEGFGGTSAAAPSMAGVAALLDQKMGSAQGSLNPAIYELAVSSPTAFHDATVASSGVTGCTVDAPSMCNNSLPSPTGLTGGQTGFLLTEGYDLVTGWGSLDVTNFLNDYQSLLITPTVKVTPSAASTTTTQALTVAITVSGGAGTPTGSVVLTSGSYSSGSTNLSNGLASIVIPAGALAVGTDTLTAKYTPDATGSATYTSATGSGTVAVSQPITLPPPTFSISASAVTISPGATTGNVSTVTVTPANGFTGAVALTAAITFGPNGAQDPPTLSFGATSPITISGTASGTATLTIATTAPTSSALAFPVPHRSNWLPAGGTALACILLFGIPARQRRWRSRLAMLALLVSLAGAVSACGGGGGGSASGGGKNTNNPGTTAGSYTVEVTGTSGSTTASGTFTIDLQ